MAAKTQVKVGTEEVAVCLLPDTLWTSMCAFRPFPTAESPVISKRLPLLPMRCEIGAFGGSAVNWGAWTLPTNDKAAGGNGREEGGLGVFGFRAFGCPAQTHRLQIT